MIEFKFKDNSYSYIPFSQLSVDELPERKTYQQSMYLDIGCGFDIETSRIGEEKLSTMYVWQFSLNKITVIGRTWEEFKEFLQILQNHYKLDSKNRLLVWVANLSFEFSFIKGQCNWLIERKKPSIFALDKRSVIKATTEEFIEFRDSVVLTQLGLGKMAKNFGLSVQKLQEDTNFNYDLPRHSLTPLTNEELAYCINDVQILSEWYHKYIKKEFVAKKHKIPLTSTSIVRQDLRRRWKKVPKKEKVKYKKFLERSFPTKEIYTAWIEWLYRGGFTHANASLTDYILDTFVLGVQIGAYDLKSSYPASLLHNKYPSRFVEKPIEWFDKYGSNMEFIENYAYFGTFEFTNIRAKTQHSIESKNKLIDFDNGVFDNGRLISADRIQVCLNEIDYLNYIDFYTWDDVDCLDFYVSDKIELPKFIKDLILDYYALKEKPGIDPYIRKVVAKPRLNSIYGMMVSGLFNADLIYNPTEKVFKEKENSKTYESIISKQLLLPQWGIWCTSYSRRAVLYPFKKTNDCIYGDTDSCKLVNADSHKWIFDAYNDKMERINKSMYVGEHNRDLFLELGKFEDETEESGRIIKFKTLGAKRYIYTTMKDGELHHNVTVAGLKKGSLQKYCKKYDKDIYISFSNKLKLIPEDSEKLTTSYYDIEFTREFTDYLGNTTVINEQSCVTLYSIPFEMNMTKDYISLLDKIKTMNECKMIKRRY